MDMLSFNGVNVWAYRSGLHMHYFRAGPTFVAKSFAERGELATERAYLVQETQLRNNTVEWHQSRETLFKYQQLQQMIKRSTIDDQVQQDLITLYDQLAQLVHLQEEFERQTFSDSNAFQFQKTAPREQRVKAYRKEISQGKLLKDGKMLGNDHRVDQKLQQRVQFKFHAVDGGPLLVSNDDSDSEDGITRSGPSLAEDPSKQRQGLTVERQPIARLHQLADRVRQLEEIKTKAEAQVGRSLTTKEWAAVCRLPEAKLRTFVARGQTARQELMNRATPVLDKAMMYGKFYSKGVDAKGSSQLAILDKLATNALPTDEKEFFAKVKTIGAYQAQTDAAKSEAVRINSGYKQQASKVRKAEEVLTTQLGRPPTIEEVAGHLGMKPQTVVNAKYLSSRVAYASQTIGGGGSSQRKSENHLTMEESMPAIEENIYDRLAQEQFDRDLSLVFDGLTEQHQQVFLFMSGLAEGQRYSLEETAQFLELEVESVAQMVDETRQHLRNPSRVRRLAPYLQFGLESQQRGDAPGGMGSSYKPPGQGQ